MTKQYKNPFEDPDEKLWDQKIKDYKIPKRKEAPVEKKAKHIAIPNIEDYIYVPSIKLYVAKERTWLDLDWYQTHERLHKEGLQMLTPRQFIDFILYLKSHAALFQYLKQKKSNIPDAKKILDEIFTEREPFRGEWLDAYFTKENEKLFINYNHQIVNDKMVAKQEPLEKCLMKDYLRIDLSSCNKQGLPTKRGDYTQYHCPKESQVAVFVRGSMWAGLRGDWNPYFNNSIGVRPAFKIGGKK